MFVYKQTSNYSMNMMDLFIDYFIHRMYRVYKTALHDCAFISFSFSSSMDGATLKRKIELIIVQSDPAAKRACTYPKLTFQSVSIERNIFDEAIIASVKRDCPRDAVIKTTDYELLLCRLHDFVKSEKSTIQSSIVRILNRRARMYKNNQIRMRSIFADKCLEYMNRSMWDKLTFHYAISKGSVVTEGRKHIANYCDIDNLYPGKFSVVIKAMVDNDIVFRAEYQQRYKKRVLSSTLLKVFDVSKSFTCHLFQPTGELMLCSISEESKSAFSEALLDAFRVLPHIDGLKEFVEHGVHTMFLRKHHPHRMLPFDDESVEEIASASDIDSESESDSDDDSD